MAFKLKGYEVLRTPYVDQIISSKPDQSHEDAVQTVLTFLAEHYLDALNGRDESVIFEAQDLGGRKLPECFALVVPVARVILFGTESEVRTAAEGR